MGNTKNIAEFCSLEERKLAQETARKQREEQCNKEVLLSVEHLSVTLSTEDGKLPALDDLSFSMSRGETLAVVGESGCGKSMTALSVMGLLPQPPAHITGGKIVFEGVDDIAESGHEGRGSNSRRYFGPSSQDGEERSRQSRA